MKQFEKLPAILFSDESWLAENFDSFREYIEYRVHGYFASVAFRRVYGEENSGDTYTHHRIENLEATRLYRDLFARRLSEVKISELWNTKVSVHELLSLTRNPFAKDTTRLQAAKELNVLVGITVVDENGKTKAGASLEDFYKTEGNSKPDESAAPATTH